MLPFCTHKSPPPWRRITNVLVVLSITVGSLGSACGGQSSAASALASSGCEEFIDARIKCFVGTNDASIVHDRSLAVRELCSQETAYPGTSLTDASFRACAQVLERSCDMHDLACSLLFFHAGSLSEGAPCNVSHQCQSAHCDKTQGTGSTPWCGTCAHGTAPIADSRADVGAQCRDSIECRPGLVCGSSSACRLSYIGTACSTQLDCISPLYCDALTSTCRAPTWVPTRSACAPPAISCSVGHCTPMDTCPSVIADGQACSTNDPTQSCDAESFCENGVCIFGFGPVCR